MELILYEWKLLWVVIMMLALVPIYFLFKREKYIGLVYYISSITVVATLFSVLFTFQPATEDYRNQHEQVVFTSETMSERSIDEVEEERKLVKEKEILEREREFTGNMRSQMEQSDQFLKQLLEN